MSSVAAFGRTIAIAMIGLFFAVGAAAAEESGVVNLPEGVNQAVLQIGGVDTTVENGDTVSVDDSIGTQSHDIVVTLSDGTVITALAGTTFSFEVINGVPTVVVAGGTVTVASNDPSFTVVAGGQTLSGTSLVASVDESGNGSVTPGEATAGITTAGITPQPGNITIATIEIVENAQQDSDDGSPQQ